MSKKDDILKVARTLFQEKGLNNTSTNDIAHAVGISRGTLYYHFESKEVLINALVEKICQDLFLVAKDIAGNTAWLPEERFIRVMTSLNAETSQDEDLLKNLNHPDNRLLHLKIQQQMLHELPPILATIVEDGNASGVFKAAYPLEAMEILVAYVVCVIDEEAVQADSELEHHKILSLIKHMELILGAKEGLFLRYLS
ncbi:MULTISPECIES: TetR/AcrR family transcriptional regulator [Aerococcus]|nr:TetR/AcrR family transcriptional regulator [Aerococcus urinae]MDK6370494.1 TetR/AcrR family transcriptional regulator [Aerococcus urinae]MDK6596834.1 TetR/AcrR family transcriptional regulator [Aerococcus urinae]MDK7302297.1 TetR/AcrR family transcriptional regulator [Aerococcus urinae]MDK7800750.1 TetR/AcrR family transcriptional regulator [Aerococcus urinae]MDK8654771.1 TetR/AcrR family transcriptional regulator [Aerococcus urinae]